MSRKKIIAAVLATAATVALLAGCTFHVSTTGLGSKPSASNSSGSGSADKPSKGSSNGGSATPPTTASAPGTKAGVGQWVSYNFTTTDKTTALLAAQLVSVQQATQAQTDLLVSKIPDLKGYTVWLIHVKEQKVSGASVVYNDDSNNFYAASADGKKVQGVSVIGWDDCTTNSFTTEFDTAGAQLDQCIVGATKQGDPAPAGVIYASFDDKTLDYYDGKPLQLMK